jgi:hypothetical protein
MFKNLFGKKNDGFFMQIDESKPAAKAESPKPEQKVADAAPAPVVETPAAVETPSAVPSGAAPAEMVATPEPTKATKTSVKDKKKKEKASKTDEKVAPSSEKVAAAVAAPAQIFKNFATDYLIQPSSNGSRRRPGANMKNFVDMAREVKVKK